MKKLSKQLIIVTVCIAMIPATLFVFDSNKLQTTRYDIYSEKLPGSFDGFKIVQVSDFHNEAIEYPNVNIIDAINQEDPDVIVLTGDFIDEYTKNLTKIEAFLSGLADYVILYENGNHDIRADLYDEFRLMLATYGGIDISGDRYTFNNGEDQLAFIGVDQTFVDDKWGPFTINIDPVLYPHIHPLLDEADDFRILSSHHPDFYHEAASLGFDVMLSGHYHGGHIRLLDWSPINWIDKTYDGGHFKSEDMNLIVSRGAGSGFFPIRINADAEIVSLTLKHGTIV